MFHIETDENVLDDDFEFQLEKRTIKCVLFFQSNTLKRDIVISNHFTTKRSDGTTRARLPIIVTRYMSRDEKELT